MDLADRPDGPCVVVSAPGQAPDERPVRWTAGRRLLVARDEPVGDDEASALADAVDRGGADAAAVERYGRLLFEAAFDGDTWQRLVAAAAGQPCLELAIRGDTGHAPDNAAEQEDTVAALQALRWEAIHDGAAHVAAKGAVPGLAGQGPGATAGPPAQLVPVGIVRLVPLASPRPGADEASAVLPRISRIPRVLFAVGSRLTDPRVRSGAEFMGILRHLERNGGSIQPRLVESASAEKLKTEIARFQPDILHAIGHGRWDPFDECVKLQLNAESGTGDDWVTASQLLGIFTGAMHVPTLVVLSACQTASAGPGTEQPVNALPFAARLVAGGVPVVIAMAGDISDTACRVFTRALTQAIGDGVPLADAVIRGRRAAFYDQPNRESTDWMLPAIFLDEHLSADSSLVDVAAISPVRERLHALDLEHDPVFCGRREFIDEMDLLLDDTKPVNVLVAYTPDASNSYGGLRLLQELAARAVRAGHVPVLLGPYDQGQPTDHVRFAKHLSTKITEIRINLGLEEEPDGIVTEALEYTDLKDSPLDIVAAIRKAFTKLAADLSVPDPGPQGQQPKVVLLCHRVDKWGDALGPLLKMLGPPGLHPGRNSVPVVLTGAHTGELAEMHVAKSTARWVHFLPLGRFRSDADDPEDILAYQWWWLNPEDQGTPVYAPRRGEEGWHALIRNAVDERPLYAKKHLLNFAQNMVSLRWFTADMDADILDAYARGRP